MGLLGEIDPLLAAAGFSPAGAAAEQVEFEPLLDTAEEAAAHNPPTSRVPRLHCVITRSVGSLPRAQPDAASEVRCNYTFPV